MVVELTERVWQFKLRGVNAYLVADDVLTLVDAGTPLDEDAIRTGVVESGHEVGDIERVLLIHCDLDHVGALEPSGWVLSYDTDTVCDTLAGRPGTGVRRCLCRARDSTRGGRDALRAPAREL